MWTVMLAAICVGRVSGDPTASSDFISQPQDATVPPGALVELDCELVEPDVGDVCAWRVSGTHLGVDHFYNVFPPPKVCALFPEHERVCSIVIEDIDRDYDGLWTCWPLGPYSHVSSRAARVTVTETPLTTETPPPWTTTQTSPEPSTTRPEPTTLTTEGSTITWWTLDPASSLSPATTPTAPASSTQPTPGFTCPQPFGLFADPANERYYYACADGVAVHMQCELPKTWNDDIKNCA